MLATTIVDLPDVRKRAAEIRGKWSAGERRRRKGLPPDAPAKLRDYMLSPRAVAWPIASRV